MLCYIILYYIILYIILYYIILYIKDHLVRAKLPNVEITGQSEICGKWNCQVCDFMDNTDTFSRYLTVTLKRSRTSENAEYGEKLLPYVSKTKTKLRARFNIYKSAHRSLQKNTKYHSNASMNIMGNTAIV